MKKGLFFIIAIALLVACTPKSNISGSMTDAEGKTIYLEHTGLTATTLLDSAKLDAKGGFSFSIETPQYPDFYRIRINNQSVVLALDSATKSVNIVASAKDVNNATIEGSEASLEIQRLRNSNFELQRAAKDGDTAKVAQMLTAHKRLGQEIVLANPRSAAAYYAINQTIAGSYYMSPYIKEDLPFWNAVATAWDLHYAEYERAKELKQSVLLAIGQHRNRELSAQELVENIKEEGFIDITLPNRLGEETKLSAYVGNVVLIDFSAYAMEQASAHTLFLRELYATYHELGLEIFQVSLDADKLLWLEQTRNIPWVCVRDEASVQSVILSTYNVRELPTFFLMDKEGNIVGRYNHENVEKEINRLTK
ncbi:MAG: AhpC/TSA family protein [Paludibacteraceae bacterium]|nr:AhpC/TSA family protein [Paludibacteraceae bacterium]